ncbi:MAG TPA: CPBP family intramembrane glutamic endopeptidase [Thermoanaerobaculia bacterium]|nr:CPBP family intramembrane glutamic endopeptidase [Thermoanaerobaculia bacterium]
MLSRRDWRAIAIQLLLAVLSIVVIARYFSSAFPEASIDFKVDREASRGIAEKLLHAQGIDIHGMKHAASFDSDYEARVFLERSLGLANANRVMRDDVRVWEWRHRWFKPLVEEEISVDVAPTGEIIAFTRTLSEDRTATGNASPEAFLRSVGVDVNRLTLVEQSERKLPHRVQRIYTFESKSVRPAGAPYRFNVTVDGNLVTSYAQRLKVPEAWQRSYREMRSKNSAAGSIDLVLLIATMIAAVVVFIVRLRRSDLPIRFLLGIGVVSAVLYAAVSLNSLPLRLASYDTTMSYSAFIGTIVLDIVIGCIGTAMLLIVVCGAGEVLYRQQFPQHLAIPRLWTPKALNSRRVFLSLILGYALVPMFIAYQVIFYLVAQRFGAWSPQEVPYDDILNSAVPWAAVLFAGFFPALNEEFLSRAFSIPFLQRILRSRVAAIVIAGFLWGFGHATYPNQPFWIRGVEVGIVGVIAGLLLFRFGLLPLLIWHYTIDAVYTATLLFASGNTYYIVSAAVASLLFALPLIVSIFLYIRNRGFAPDDDLTNATLPIAPPPEHAEVAEVAAQFPEPIRVTPARVAICITLIVIAALAIAFRPTAPDDAIDYRITKEQAKNVARTRVHAQHAYVIATPVEGFRNWERDSPREEGGSPGGFDGVAADDLLHRGMKPAALANVFRQTIEAGTYTVRFFTPMKKEEYFVEVDPRTSRPLGYHKYQDERNPGASLDQAHALAIARGAFASYGFDANAFDVKEALSFQQPSRRDWLFHFEERTPLFANAHRRVTIRVAGSEVTQFNKTIKVPDSVYREAQTQTLVNVVVFVLKIAAIVAALAIVITGLVLATRSHGLPWRRALRWTAILSIIPIATFFAQYETTLFSYNTSVAWETFRVSLITLFVRDVGLRLGILFLALAGLEAAVPYAMSVLRAEGRARFGRSAVIASLTALALLAIVAESRTYVDNAYPAGASVQISAPQEVVMPLPALFDGAEAFAGAIVFSAAIALFAVTMRKHAALTAAAIAFFMTLDPSASMSQTPLMLVRAIVAAALIFVVARVVLDANPLAWPLTFFLAALLQAAATMLRNHRPDLIANGAALLVLAAIAIVFVARRSDARVV